MQISRSIVNGPKCD